MDSNAQSALTSWMTVTRVEIEHEPPHWPPGMGRQRLHAGGDLAGVRPGMVRGGLEVDVVRMLHRGAVCHGLELFARDASFTIATAQNLRCVNGAELTSPSWHGSVPPFAKNRRRPYMRKGAEAPFEVLPIVSRLSGGQT